MRIAHWSDTHLGYTRGVSSHRPDAIQQDVAASFSRTIDQIIAAQPGAVIHSGDLFHSSWPGYAPRLLAFRELRRLRAGVKGPIVIIAGNHDTSRDRTSLHPFELLREVDGVDVVYRGAELLEYPGLSVYAVPDEALRKADRVDLSVRGEGRFKVMALHAPIGGVAEGGRSHVAVAPSELPAAWDYIALGDFHVTSQVKKNAWYPGSTDFVSSDNWGEQRSEVEQGFDGKAWLLVDLETGAVERKGPTNERVLVDLLPIQGLLKSASEIEAAMLARVEAIGGVDGKVVRQVVHDIPREVEVGIDRKLLQSLRGTALHYQLDANRPAYRTSSLPSVTGKPWSLMTEKERDAACPAEPYDEPPPAGRDDVLYDEDLYPHAAEILSRAEAILNPRQEAA